MEGWVRGGKGHPAATPRKASASASLQQCRRQYGARSRLTSSQSTQASPPIPRSTLRAHHRCIYSRAFVRVCNVAPARVHSMLARARVRESTCARVCACGFPLLWLCTSCVRVRGTR